MDQFINIALNRREKGILGTHNYIPKFSKDEKK